MPTRAVVQHRDRFVRTGLVLVLDREPDIEVVGAAATPAELVTSCTTTRPDVVLLELDAPTWDAPRLAAALRRRQRTLSCVGLYSELTPHSARRAYQAGVRAMVAYSGGTEGIIAALRGRPSTTPVIDLTMSRPSAREALLTPRELEILRLIAAGKLTREIAVALGVTIKTVENHKQRLFRKLDVQNQAHAVSIAIRRGLLTPATPVAHRA